MSKNLEQVIQRAISDAAFRRQLQANPEATLRGFKLTSDEVAALRSGDPGKLISLGIDQRMSKTFSFGGDADLASRATAGGDMTSVGGTALIDPGTTAGVPRDVTVGTSGTSASIDPGNVDGSATSVGDPMSATATSDALEDQSHAFASHNAGDDTVRSAVRDVAPVDLTGTTTSDAIEDQSIAFADRNAGTDAVRSAVRDVAPVDLTGTTTSDAMEDQSHAFAAHNAGDDAVRSAVRDVEPGFGAGSGLVAPVEGSPEAFAFRDASDDTGAQITRIHDVAPPETISAANSTDDAFLTAGQAQEYATSTDPNWSSDLAEDTSHAFTPGTEGIGAGSTDADHHDTEISN